MHDQWADDIIERFARIMRATVGDLAQGFLSGGQVQNSPARQIEQVARGVLLLTKEPNLVRALVWRNEIFVAYAVLLLAGMTPEQAEEHIKLCREHFQKQREGT